jgi:6-phosphogluconolactonase
VNLRIVDDPAAEAASLIAEAVREGGNIALAGGSTPKAAYRRVAETAGLDWSAATLWFGDERCVPPDDESSNYRMAKEALLDRLAGDPPDVRRMAGEKGPHAGAEDYERELQEALGEQLPRLDLVLLGLGPDAHTASLFPGQPTLQVNDRAVTYTERAGMPPDVPRITLTLATINAARRVVFLVAGEDKSDAVRRAFGGERSPDAPASLVTDEALVLLDEGAASRLPR